MSKDLIFKIINFLALGIILACIIPAGKLLELNPYLLGGDIWSENHQIINLLYNSYHTWSFDPLLSRLLANYQSPALIFTYSFFFFAVGWFLLLRKNLEQENSFLIANFKSLILTLAILATFGFIFEEDLILLSAFTWVPFLILASQNFLEKKFTSILYLLLASALVITSSNQLSILFLVIIIAVLLLQNKNIPLSLTRKSYQTIVIFLILLCSSLYIFYYPKTNFYDYAINQRVISEDFLIGLTQPLFGPVNPIKFLELRNIETQLSGVVDYLLLCSIALLFLLRRNRATWVLFLFNAIIFLDQRTSYQLKHILPLETISRLMPHWSFFAMAIVCAALSIAITVILLISNKKSDLVLPFLAFLVTSHLLFSFQPPESLEMIRASTNSNLTVDFKLLNSPSAQIVLSSPQLDFYKLEKLGRRIFRPIKKIHPVITASNNQEEISLLFDKDPETTWGTKLGKQTGKEWLLISLPHPVLIEGLKISAGSRHTDFARGVKVSASLSCDPQEADYQIVYEKNPWIGSLSFTKLGYPYYTHESEVKIFFPRTSVQCLKIEQTGENLNFEWAINEIKFLK